MIDFKKPVQTIGRLPVEIISTTGRGKYPVVGYIGNGVSLSSWTLDGRFYPTDDYVGDLENVPEPPVELWINIYPEHIGRNKYTTKKEAGNNMYSGRIACIRVTYRPGEGL